MCNQRWPEDPEWSEAPDGMADRPAADLTARVLELSRLVDRGIVKAVSPYDLTSLEFSILKICLEAGSERTATQLVQAIPVDGARISRLVAGLVDKGLLRRRRRRSDRRVVMLSLTESGRALAARAIRSVQRYEASLLEGVGDAEASVFRAVISKIAANHASSL